jgi:hypothetical protein
VICFPPPDTSGSQVDKAVLSMFAAGPCTGFSNTGIVLKSGHAESRVSAFYEGMEVRHMRRRSDVAGRHVAIAAGQALGKTYCIHRLCTCAHSRHNSLPVSPSLSHRHTQTHTRVQSPVHTHIVFTQSRTCNRSLFSPNAPYRSVHLLSQIVFRSLMSCVAR